jgi:alkylated DNA repair dioxygenase AlkB
MDGGCERFDPGDGALALYAQAFVAEAPAWFAALMAEVRWEQHWLSLFGRRIAAPRLSAWYAEPGCSYRYSGLYRDGADGMSWHSDDEPELGPAPLIASVSLGATRRLLLRRRDAHDARLGLDLGDGSLLLMEPPLQCYWQHSVPKTRRAVGPRINLTWRRILTR